VLSKREVQIANITGFDSAADSSLILVKYRKDKSENVRFVAVANFLDGIGVNAPLIYFHDDEEG